MHLAFDLRDADARHPRPGHGQRINGDVLYHERTRKPAYRFSGLR
jgi:hypothetical protein